MLVGISYTHSLQNKDGYGGWKSRLTIFSNIL